MMLESFKMIWRSDSKVTVILKMTVTSDTVLFAAYGWKSDLSDEEIPEKLLSLNLERNKEESKARR